LIVVGDGFGMQRRSMAVVGCGDVRRCAAMRLFPLVVIKQAEEEDG
jgi:hypothetical protein